MGALLAAYLLGASWYYEAPERLIVHVPTQVEMWVDPTESLDLLLMDVGLFAGPVRMTSLTVHAPNPIQGIHYNEGWYGFGSRLMDLGPEPFLFATATVVGDSLGYSSWYEMPIESGPEGIAITGFLEFEVWPPACDGPAGDMNGDGMVNGLDIDLFIKAVIRGDHAPEPTTLQLALVALTGVLLYAGLAVGVGRYLGKR